MKKVCVAIGSRANYSSIRSVLHWISKSDSLTLQILAFSSATLDRYGCVTDLIEKDGFSIDEKIFNIVEGETPLTMAKSTGLALIEIPQSFQRLLPDVVISVGDRYETMATVLAAAYMNIPIAHTMGGEVSGTIDESIRHAITKFAHIHFASNSDAASRIISLGEPKEHVFDVGCPRIDLVREILSVPIDLHCLNKEISKVSGVGREIDVTQPFLLMSQHPVTTEYGSGEREIFETLEAVENICMQTIVLWPNSDAGSSDLSRGLRKWRELKPQSLLKFYKNLPVDVYIKLMGLTKCLVGNSSSGIREGAFIGTPVVNVGSRQNRRLAGNNVINVSSNRRQIFEALKTQIKHGPYDRNPLYGEGNAGEQIERILSNFTCNIQKTITY